MTAFFLNAVFLLLRRLLVAVILFMPCAAAAALSLVPPKDITPIAGQETPLWKERWDEARRLVRQGVLEEAAVLYRKVLEEKPLVEAATWEYCQLLFALGKNTVLPSLLGRLIETDPYNNDYLTMAGLVALSRGEYEKALQWLGESYGAAPQGASGRAALAGLVDALVGLGRFQYAFPLMEQLYQRDPERPELVENLAKTAKKLGFLKKAKEYYTLLIDQPEPDEKLLADAAEALLAVEDDDGAAVLWQRLVAKQPDNLEYRKMLAEYFQERGRNEEALPHLLYLIENQTDYPAELLLVAARIAANDAGRADKAVGLFERYLGKMPENREVRAEMDAVRHQLSKELLPVAEHGEAVELWQDLSAMTVDPQGIFLDMATTFEKKNNVVAAIRLLDVLVEKGAKDRESLFLRLSRLNEQLGNKQRAYRAWCKVEQPEHRSDRWYQKKIQFEQELGLDLAAYQTTIELLERTTDSQKLLSNAVRMAGTLGFAEDLERLGAQVALTGPGNYQNVLDYCAALRRVGALLRAEEMYDQLLQQSWLQQGQRREVLLARAALYGEAELSSQQQQQYRMLLVENVRDLKAIQFLFAWAIETGDLDAAQALFTLLDKGAAQQDGTKWLDITTIARGQLLEAEGDFDEAIDLIEKSLRKLRIDHGGQRRLKEQLIAEQCRVLLAAGKPRAAKRILSQYYDFSRKNVQRLCGQGALVELFALAAFAEKSGFLTEAEKILAAIVAAHPNSVRARLALARLYEHTKKWQQSVLLFGALAQEFPEEPYYQHVVLQLAMRLGEYPEVIAETEALQETAYRRQLRFLRARALWAAGRFADSLLLYETILEPSVDKLLEQRLAENNIDLSTLGAEGWPFWKIFYFDPANRLDTLYSISEKGGFLDLVGSDAAPIIASLYAAYRYEKLVKNEYLARKAIAENRYIAAKRQYKKSLKDEKNNAEWLKDLAKIYERLGDYDKEAVVYSVLTERGETSPEVEESITRSKRLRSPYLGPEYLFLGKNGRDGAIDIKRWSGGAGFGFSLAPGHAVKLQYHELGYEDEAEENTLDGRLFQVSGKWDVTSDTSLQYALGYHVVDQESEKNILCRARLERDFSGKLVGYLEYDRDIVIDTIESLSRGITVQQLLLGVEIEANNGFSMGAEFAETWYSDDNSRAQIALWSKYAIFTEFASFTFGYDFEILANSDSGEEIFNTVSGTTDYDLPYWSPKQYWRHRASVSYKHLLKNFHLFKEDVSSYTLNLNAGLEADESAFFTGELDIFLEISDHFLLKGDLLYSVGSDYEESQVAASLVYRW